MKIKRLFLLCTFVSSALFIGCSTLKSDPAENSTLLKDSHKMTEQRERFPLSSGLVRDIKNYE